ncbi:DegV family protein [Clostridium folliculivorans]|uniref:DegV domain-containing protein n=1 Tax=Clostridium folliculivorans TaxID=2886038 RepID=A0A9W5Y3S3_9CLOT|nr:DegV family protein [Clostridium folliculivorans]GKU26098.1 DegV domain-containing protein [Clostridium folliculivorans]GKU28184.1 DegV domain-containing protein [Clostridium folliculivorans]
MQKIALITDSGCDLDTEILNKYNIFFLPLRIIYKDNDYLDRLEISPEDLYLSLEKEIPKTSLPDGQFIENILNQIEAQGYTHAISISISSGLSGTANSLRIIAENHPNLKTYIFDSKTLSMPQGSIALVAAEMIESGSTFEEIIEVLPKLREKTDGYFTLNTLDYLKKGGRIGKVSGTIGEMLNIKPVISINDDGVYFTHSKARGRKQAIGKLREILDENLSIAKCKVWVLQGGALDEAKAFFEVVKDLPNITHISISTIGPALGVHTGPGLLGLAIQRE